MPTPPRAGMRDDIEGLITEWGSVCTISRLSGALNTEGRFSGAFLDLTSSEVLWIQPTVGFSRVIEFGLNEQTTHFAWQKHDGTTLRAKDKVLVTGDTLKYDVIRVHLKESHRIMELKQIQRS